jgi:hypothetical protein
MRSALTSVDKLMPVFSTLALEVVTPFRVI